MVVTVSRAIPDDLPQIKALQTANLSKHISADESAREGFLTAEYTLDFLQLMHDASPSIVAKDGDQVIGYALVTTKAIVGHHDLLDHLFTFMDGQIYENQHLKSRNYLVVGQLCVAKSHRSQGIVQAMYTHFKACYADSFDMVVTEIAETNLRSIRAHEKSGFQILHHSEYDGIKFVSVIWDWRKC